MISVRTGARVGTSRSRLPLWGNVTDDAGRAFDEKARRSASRRMRVLALTGIVIIVFLAVTGITSHVLGARTSEYRCTVKSVSEASLRDGRPAWHLGTTCGGTIYIDSEATHQTVAQAKSLASDLRTGQRYELTVRGVLHNPLGISAYLLNAKTV